MGEVVALDRFASVKKELHEEMRDWEGAGIRIGEMLREVQANPEWYRSEGFDNLADWAQKEFDLSPRHCRNLVNLSAVVDELDEKGTQFIPANERQARVFNRLNSNERVMLAERVSMHEQEPTARELDSLARHMFPGAYGFTTNPKVAEKRAAKRWKRRIEAACETLVGQDPVAYKAANGVPASAEAAYKFLGALLERR